MLTAITLTLALSLTTPPSLSADALLLVHELSSEDLTRIDLHDGSVTDWFDVLGEPTLTARDFPRSSSTYDPNDFDLRLWLAWHSDPPRIYCAMERVDDIFINYAMPEHPPYYEFFGNDGTIHLLVDADHSGGNYRDPSNSDPPELWERENAQAQWYVGGVPTTAAPALYLGLNGYGYPVDWFVRPPWADGGGRIFSEQPVVSVTEFFFTPFDHLVYDDADLSQVSRLRAGATIGLNVSVYDYDVDRRPNNYSDNVAYYLSRAVGLWYDSSDWPDAILWSRESRQTPRNPENGSLPVDAWGRIKSSQVP